MNKLFFYVLANLSTPFLVGKALDEALAMNANNFIFIIVLISIICFAGVLAGYLFEYFVAKLVQNIIKQYHINGKLNFIIGTDAFAKIDSWYKADILKQLVHFIVFPRRGDNITNLQGWDFEFADMELVDVSSTEIRQKISNNVDKKVEDYIEKYGLYKV